MTTLTKIGRGLLGVALAPFADLTPSERVARVLWLAIVLGGAVALLAGCDAPVDTRPGSPIEIDPATVTAVETAPGAVILR